MLFLDDETVDMPFIAKAIPKYNFETCVKSLFCTMCTLLIHKAHCINTTTLTVIYYHDSTTNTNIFHMHL